MKIWRMKYLCVGCEDLSEVEEFYTTFDAAKAAAERVDAKQLFTSGLTRRSLTLSWKRVNSSHWEAEPNICQGYYLDELTVLE